MIVSLAPDLRGKSATSERGAFPCTLSVGFHDMPRTAEFVVVAALAATSVIAAWTIPGPTTPGLAGRYWTTTEAAGTPTAESVGALPMALDVVRHVPSAWRASRAEWTGYLLVDVTGTQQIEIDANGTASLFVNGALVADGGTGQRVASGRVTLPAGAHQIRISHAQAGGPVRMAVRWTRPDGRSGLLAARDLVPSLAASRLGGWLPFVRGLSVAVPIVWACLFLYVPVRVAVWWTRREVVRVTPGDAERRALAGVLLLAFGLMIWGLEWGLTETAWAADELRPGLVRDVIARRLAGGWFDKYPLMHYAVLAIPVSAFELAGKAGVLPADAWASHVAQFAMMRVVSVVMGLGLVVSAYLCGAELYGSRRAVLAALALALTPLVVYYGKVANLDVPFMCFFGFALLSWLRILKTHRRQDYVRFGVCAAAAVATKDQAYASLALLPLVVLGANAAQQPFASVTRRLGAALVDTRVLLAGVAAAAAFVLFHNLLFNFAGFVEHVRVLRTFDDIGIVPRTAAGYAELAVKTIDLFRFAFGWPTFLLAIAGVMTAAVRAERRWWLWMLAVPLSFHFTFTLVTLFVCDRYLFAGVFVLALFAGSAMADLFDAVRARHLAKATVAAALFFALLRSASINVMMNRDSRYEAQAWLRAHAQDADRVGLVGDYLPAVGPPLEPVVVRAAEADVRQAGTEWLLLNARYAQRYEAARRPEGREMLRALENGTLGYVEVFRYRAPLPGWAVLQYDRAFEGQAESLTTNLDKINPEVTILRRSR